MVRESNSRNTTKLWKLQTQLFVCQLPYGKLVVTTISTPRNYYVAVSDPQVIHLTHFSSFFSLLRSNFGSFEIFLEHQAL